MGFFATPRDVHPGNHWANKYFCQPDFRKLVAGYPRVHQQAERYKTWVCQQDPRMCIFEDHGNSQSTGRSKGPDEQRESHNRELHHNESSQQGLTSLPHWFSDNSVLAKARWPNTGRLEAELLVWTTWGGRKDMGKFAHDLASCARKIPVCPS